MSGTVIQVDFRDKSSCPFCKSNVAPGEVHSVVGHYVCGVEINKPYPTIECIENLQTDIQFWKSLHHDDVENPYKDLA